MQSISWKMSGDALFVTVSYRQSIKNRYEERCSFYRGFWRWQDTPIIRFSFKYADNNKRVDTMRTMFGNRVPLGMAIMSASAVAMGDASLALEEVIVTAQKREQSLQDVPLAVSAFGEDFIQQSGATEFTGLAGFTPGLVADNSRQGFPTISVRGISTADFGLGSEPSVAVYVDGVYQGRSGGLVGELLDVAQIEVLKGPQGTLFGRNAAGGAISITKNKPTDELSFKVGVDVGSYNLRKVHTVFNTPIFDDKLNMRGSISKTDRDGWLEDINGNNDGGEKDNANGNLRFAWYPSDDVSVEFSNEWERTSKQVMVPVEIFAFTNDRYATSTNDVHVLNQTLTALGKEAVNSRTFNIDDKYYANSMPEGDHFSRRSRGHSVKVQWDLNDEMTFSSLSAYREFTFNWIVDLDGTEANIGSVPFSTQKMKTYSQEFRLSGSSERVDWFVGVSAYKENSSAFDVTSVDLVLPTPFGLFPVVGSPGYAADLEVKSYAVFSDIIWRLTDDLNLTTGIRYSHDSKTHEIDGDNTFAEHPVISTLVPTFDENRHANWDNVSPRVVLDYSLSDDVLVYGGVSQGFKSGGFNSTTSTPNAPAFSPEKITNFEVGAKATTLDGRVRVNATAFFFKYEDLQVLTQAGGLGFQIRNAGKAESKGVEFDLAFVATEALTISASGAWLDARYKEYDDGVIDRANQRLVRAPEWTGSLGVDYVIAADEAGEFRANINYSYTGDQLYSDEYGPLGKVTGYGLLGGRLSFTTVSADLTFAVYGSNLTDETYIADMGNGLASLGFLGVRRNEPRTLGVAVEYNF